MRFVVTYPLYRRTFITPPGILVKGRVVVSGKYHCPVTLLLIGPFCRTPCVLGFTRDQTSVKPSRPPLIICRLPSTAPSDGFSCRTARGLSQGERPTLMESSLYRFYIGCHVTGFSTVSVKMLFYSKPLRSNDVEGKSLRTTYVYRKFQRLVRTSFL